jgi:TrmH family RNA methyltransferase
MGSEANGVSDKWLKTNFHQILIPMYGKADSLNISVSAAIVCMRL